MKLILFLSMIFLISCSQSEFDTKLSETGIKSNFNNEFQLKSYNQFPFILIGKDKDDKVQLKIQVKKVKSVEEANAEVNKAVFLTNSQYEFTLAPYPGQITDAANCGVTKKPQKIKVEKFNFIKKYTNERLALSICDTDPSSYTLFTSYFYDKSSSNVIIVDYYVSGETGDPLAFFSKHFSDLTNLELP